MRKLADGSRLTYEALEARYDAALADRERQAELLRETTGRLDALATENATLLEEVREWRKLVNLDPNMPFDSTKPPTRGNT